MTNPRADADRMRAFHSLTRAEQSAAIRRLAATGMTEHGIASATQLSVEMVRRVLTDAPRVSMLQRQAE